MRRKLNTSSFRSFRISTFEGSDAGATQAAFDPDSRLHRQHDGDSIQAADAEAEVIGGICVVRFRLKAVNENQRLDEEQLHHRELLSIHITDEQVIEELGRYCKARSHEITNGMRVEISSRAKTISFS